MASSIKGFLDKSETGCCRKHPQSPCSYDETNGRDKRIPVCSFASSMGSSNQQGLCLQKDGKMTKTLVACVVNLHMHTRRCVFTLTHTHSTYSIHEHVKNLKHSYQSQEQGKYAHFLLVFNTVLKVFARRIRQLQETKGIKIEK